MRDYTVLRERYMREPLPIRIGSSAANLARVTSFSDNDQHGDVIESLLDESKFFIEWTAADADVDTAAELVELQVRLARWQHNWERIWSDPTQRQLVARQAHAWSERILERSGLLK
jgi:hypothetical protein